MMWFREWLRQRLFTKAWKQAAREQLYKGQIDVPTYAKCASAAEKPKVMRALMKQTETAPGLYGGIADWDWDSILKWVREFFIPLVKALLPLLVLLDEE